MQSLLQLCIEAVVKYHPQLAHVNYVEEFPQLLVDKLLKMMCTRGLLNDENADKFIHKGVAEINLSECDIGDDTLKSLCQCPQLTSLGLGHNENKPVRISSPALKKLSASCVHLVTVLLQSCVNLTDDAIIELSQCCPKLEELDISGCRLLTDQSLTALGQYSANLLCINFSKTVVSDAGVNNLVHGVCGSQLQEIIMERCAHITDESLLMIVSSCTNLTILSFYGCPQITDESRELVAQKLSTLSKLKQISWTIY